MLLIMVKPNVTQRFVSLNIWESLHVQVKTNSSKNFAVRDHMLVCNSVVSFEDFCVLGNGTNDFRIKLQESL